MKFSCPFCGQYHLNFLNDGRLECSICKIRHSPKKEARVKTLIKSFCEELSPQKIALEQNLSLPTVQNYYAKFRSLLPKFLEDIYHKKEESYNEYEEYLFLPKYKRSKLDYIAEGIGVIAFYGKGGVYTLLMPDLFQNQSSDKSLKVKISLAHYYQWHKIIKIDSRKSPLCEFWKFLEEFMKSFHGVKRNNFGLYLKEAEFKFNFTKEEQVLHLEHLWRESRIKIRRQEPRL